MTDYKQLRQALEERTPVPGITPSDILELPAPLRESIRKMLCAGAASLDELAQDLGFSRQQAGEIATLLVEKGLLVPAGEGAAGDPLYRINLSRRRAREMPPDIWTSISGSPDEFCETAD